MLATTERLALDHGLDWTFCDTDSMAIARPAEMSEVIIRSMDIAYHEEGDQKRIAESSPPVANGRRLDEA
jgi:hypothetical protein